VTAVSGVTGMTAVTTMSAMTGMTAVTTVSAMTGMTAVTAMSSVMSMFGCSRANQNRSINEIKKRCSGQKNACAH